jgi:hypothetical protein
MIELKINFLETEKGFEILVFSSTMTQLIAQEDFSESLPPLYQCDMQVQNLNVLPFFLLYEFTSIHCHVRSPSVLCHTY